MTRIASLELLHPDFAARLAELLAALAAEQIPLVVFETIRSPGRQMQLYARGRDPALPDYGRTVTDARPYVSAHQHGLAADLVFRVGGDWTWDEPSRGQWDRRDRLAAQVGLRHLLRHDGTPRERPHIQLASWKSSAAPTGPADTVGWMAWLRGQVEPVA